MFATENAVSDSRFTMEESLALAENLSQMLGGVSIDISFMTDTGMQTVSYNAKAKKLSALLPNLPKEGTTNCQMFFVPQKREQYLKIVDQTFKF